MASKNKGGRLPVSKQFILDERVRLVMGYFKKKWSHADMAILFNVDSTNITRIVNKHK